MDILDIITGVAKKKKNPEYKIMQYTLNNKGRKIGFGNIPKNKDHFDYYEKYEGYKTFLTFVRDGKKLERRE